MTDRNRELDQMLQAAMGLGASASASALRNVSEMVRTDDSQLALNQIAMLSSLSERAQTCLSVAASAEAEGDAKLAEQGWLQALSLMNHMSDVAVETEVPVAEHDQTFSRLTAGQVH